VRSILPGEERSAKSPSDAHIAAESGVVIFRREREHAMTRKPVTPLFAAASRIPWLIALLLLTALLFITVQLSRELRDAEEREVARYFNSILTHIEADLLSSARLHAAIQSRMAERLSFAAPFDSAAWRNDARQLMTDHPFYSLLAVLDDDFDVRWIAGEPASGEIQQGQAFPFGPGTRSILAGFDASMTVRLLEPVRVDGYGAGLVFATPIVSGEDSSRWLVAVLDAQSAIESMLTGFYMREVIFTGSFGDIEFVIPPDARPAGVPDPYRQQIGFQLDRGRARFDVEVTLKPDKIAELRSALPETVLVGGAITSILLVVASLLGMTASRQARIMTDANRQLQHEIRDRELAERELEFLLTHDSLTELPNRKGMLRRIERVIDRIDPSRGMAVLYVDLDQFKDINETLGHHLGDELLRQVPARLQRELEDADALGRLGGDEFLILLERRNRDRILRLARALLAAIEQPFRIGEHQLFITASIGVAMLDSRATPAAELIQNADAALFRAKQLGRNQLAVFTPEMFAKVEYRLNLSRDIRQALDNEDFRLVYQPIVDLNTLELRGLEALLRWRHTDGDDIPPRDFIRVAEETGMVHRLSRYAVTRAMADLAHWTREFRNPPWMSVNISGAQFREAGFVQELSVLLHRHKIEPDRLHLEITEEVLIENMTRNRSVLARLDEIGMPIVVDDFGVGYSSLAYIKNFPVSTIKIDQGFIRGLEHDEEDQAITRTICALSRDLRLKTVAEGIEELAQLQLLRQYGCDFGQGYLFMRPAPAEGICELLSGEPPWAILAGELKAEPGVELAD